MGHRWKYKSGNRCGMLTLIRPAKIKSKSGWEVQCDCGSIFICRSDFFSRDNPKCFDCGYRLRRMPQKTHGQARTALYKRWACMIQRCINPNYANYRNYGGRGIAVCEHWRNSFEAFIADVGHPPSDGKYTLERLDNNGDYEPSNVKWCTYKHQARNTRTNRLITIKDQTKTIAEWAELSGLKYDTIFARIKYQWPAERLLCPVKH